MKKLPFFFLLLASLAFSQRLDFIDAADGPQVWQSKVNTEISFAEDFKSLTVKVNTEKFSFGWFRRAVPVCNYREMAGVYGRFKTDSEINGELAAYVVLFRNNQPIYYHQRISALSNTHGQWREFFLSFHKFQGVRGTSGETFNTRLLTDGDNIEFTITGLQDSGAVIQFDSIQTIPHKGEEEFLKRVKRLLIANQLKAEEECTGAPHPRLLLHGDSLAKIKAKATAGGVEQLGYEAFVKQAELCLKHFNPDAPLKKIHDFVAPGNVNLHKQHASFEGIFTPTVRPIEILAAAGIITGDERYSKAAAKALVIMAENMDVNSKYMDLGFFYTRTFYIRALAFAYDWTWNLLTPEERKEVKTTILGFVLDIYNRSWHDSWGKHPLQRVWNWDPGLASCAGLGMLALEGETITEELAIIFQMRRHLKDYLTLGIDFDGSCHEGPSYINYGIGAGPEFAECLRQQGRGDLFTETNWHLIAPWNAAETLPDRTGFNNLSDCNLGQIAAGPFYSYSCGRYAELALADPMIPGEKMPVTKEIRQGMDYLAHFREAPGQRHLSYGALSRLMAWAWNSGTSSKDIISLPAHQALAHLLFYKDAPEIENPGSLLPEAMLFRGRGLAVSRVGFHKQSLHLAIEAGPHAAGHDQGDKGSFTLRAFGLDLFIDSGYGNDGERYKSGSSHAHNLVLVDGEGQPITWHNNSSGEITGFRHSTSHDWIRVNALEAWNSTFSQFIPKKTGRNMKHAERQFVLVRPDPKYQIPPYLIVFDAIKRNDDKSHAYTWLWHTNSNMDFTLTTAKWSAKPRQMTSEVLTTSQQHTKGSATFSFIAPEDGDYKLLGLTAANGVIAHKSDSFSLVVNDVSIPTWDLSGNKSLGWHPVANRGEPLPYKLTLKKGAPVTVILKSREPEACLAKMALYPYNEKIPVNPMEDLKQGQVLSAKDAVLGNPPLLLERLGNKIPSDASVTVYPATSQNGKTEIDWFEPTGGGAHPRLKHSLETTGDPNFIMVIVPCENNQQPLPLAVTDTSKDGTPAVTVKWRQRTDTISFPISKDFGSLREMTIMQQ